MQGSKEYDLVMSFVQLNKIFDSAVHSHIYLPQTTLVGFLAATGNGPLLGHHLHAHAMIDASSALSYGEFHLVFKHVRDNIDKINNGKL